LRKEASSGQSAVKLQAEARNFTASLRWKCFVVFWPCADPRSEQMSSNSKQNKAALERELRIVFVGPPGSGKGTQAANLIKDRKVCHLASGDMLRAAVASGSDVGKIAKPIMDRGELVSDDILIALVKENMKSPTCSGGFILDGFPRTKVQAEKLDSMLKADGKTLDQAFEFKIDDSILTRRITGRRIHAASGRTYHVDFAPPKVAGKDDVRTDTVALPQLTARRSPASLLCSALMTQKRLLRSVCLSITHRLNP
jgi:adenylate kinase